MSCDTSEDARMALRGVLSSGGAAVAVVEVVFCRRRGVPQKTKFSIRRLWPVCLRDRSITGWQLRTGLQVGVSQVPVVQVAAPEGVCPVTQVKSHASPLLVFSHAEAAPSLLAMAGSAAQGSSHRTMFTIF